MKTVPTYAAPFHVFLHEKASNIMPFVLFIECN